ncbi:MAG: hypothetical protein NC132_04620 [Corallococcus sp.]|nr:hypothetical protein [Corallococcus sp.]MCM1359670.1 hypothetical protein [Corallococcus sp.]MCM1395379.1 hypothetical protein [Corallococcus sp.]
MKKIPFVCLIMAICLICALPAPLALANDATAGASDSHVFLTNPVAIASVGNNVFIADNLESDHSVIFCFDVSEDTPIKTAEREFDKHVVNVAELNGELAVIFADEIVVYPESSFLPSQNESDDVYSNVYAVSGAVDVAYGTIKFGNGSSLDTTSYISAEYAKYLGTSGWIDVYSEKISAPKSVAYFDGYFYYAFDNGVQRYNGIADTNDKFNKNLSLNAGFVPTGIFTFNADDSQKLALFDGKNALLVEETYDGYTAAAALFENNANIVDVCFAANKLFVLNDNHRVEIFDQNPAAQETFVKTDKTIGTDTIVIDPPTDFTAFTLAKSLGYPTNIIYKTSNPETGITDIVTDCKNEFVILDFDGADEINYYYVMYGNKFGWIRKSAGATTPENDAKIEILNNDVGTGGVKYTSKFTSLNAVYVYKLPMTDGERIVLHQTIDNPIEFTFLQKFTEVKAAGTTVWFYIEYGEEQRGFILDGTFGQISNKTEMNEGVPCKSKKINSSLFEAVKIYMTEDLAKGQEISDTDGNVIKLYSGAHVNAVEERNGATYVQVEYHGQYRYGWIPTDNLIDVNRLTTNAIVGISLLAAAIALAITLIVVFTERRKHKRKKAQKNTEEISAEE